MPRRGRTNLVDQRVFFVTTSKRSHLHYFNSEDRHSSLLPIITDCMTTHKARLYGYALMSNHFHLMVGLSGGGPALSNLMRDIKSLTWRRIFSGEPGIWAPRFDDVAIYTEEQFSIKLNYIHNNPVKVKLVARAEDYRFSSAQVWLNGIKDGITCTDLSANIDQLSGRDA